MTFMAVSLEKEEKSGDVKAHRTLVLGNFRTLHPMHIGCHIARGWNKVPGSLLTCHKSLSWHFDDVGLTHPLLMYLSIYKKKEGSENATQRWEAKEIVKASWCQGCILLTSLSVISSKFIQKFAQKCQYFTLIDQSIPLDNFYITFYLRTNHLWLRLVYQLLTCV